MKAVIGFGEIKELLKSEKGIKIILAVGGLLILVIAFSGVFGRSGGSVRQQDTVGTAEELSEYESRLEQRLTDILSQIEGVGNVRVMVTLENTGQTEYGKNADMRIAVTAPEVRGVIVVCDGGDSITIKEKVINAVSGAFGINTLHISVTR